MSFDEQIMSKDEYPYMFSLQMKVIVFVLACSAGVLEGRVNVEKLTVVYSTGYG